MAQITYLQTRHGEPRQTITPEQSAQSFEADATLRFQNHDFPGALNAPKKWFAYQPFSSRPAVQGSYIAGVALGNFEEAVKLSRMGLLSSPEDFMLKNNLAFSLASLQRVDEAREALEGIIERDRTEYEKNVLMATKGALAFRDGSIEQGRILYNHAADGFRRERDARSETIAKFFWAREERKIGSPVAPRIAEEALTSAKKLGLKELLDRPDSKN